MNTATFPIDLNAFEPLELDPAVSPLTDSEKSSLKHNIPLVQLRHQSPEPGQADTLM